MSCTFDTVAMVICKNWHCKQIHLTKFPQNSGFPVPFSSQMSDLIFYHMIQICKCGGHLWSESVAFIDTRSGITFQFSLKRSHYLIHSTLRILCSYSNFVVHLHTIVCIIWWIKVVNSSSYPWILIKICTKHFGLYMGAIWCKFDAFLVWWIDILAGV